MEYSEADGNMKFAGHIQSTGSKLKLLLNQRPGVPIHSLGNLNACNKYNRYTSR